MFKNKNNSQALMTSQKIPIWPFFVLGITIVGGIGFLAWYSQQPTKAELAAEAKQAKIEESLALQELDRLNTSKEMIDALNTININKINKYSTMNYTADFEYGEGIEPYQPAVFISRLLGRFNLAQCTEPVTSKDSVLIVCPNTFIYEDAEIQPILIEFSSPKKIKAMYFTDDDGEKVGYK